MQCSPSLRLFTSSEVECFRALCVNERGVAPLLEGVSTLRLRRRRRLRL
jgi:hypothetical protein